MAPCGVEIGQRFRCEIIGGGRLKASLQAAIEAASLGDAVRIRSYVAQEELPTWYARAAVLAVPSQVMPDGNRDGLPNVVLEAMACGVPVVAADEGGPTEILGEGIGSRREAGWLAEPRDPEALARVMASALSLPSLVLRDVGAAGRRRAEDLYSSRQFAAQVAEVLRSASG